MFFKDNQHPVMNLMEDVIRIGRENRTGLSPSFPSLPQSKVGKQLSIYTLNPVQLNTSAARARMMLDLGFKKTISRGGRVVKL